MEVEDYLRSFPVVVEIPIAWGDMDALRHVNNAMYFRYFETARVAYADRVQMFELMEEIGVGPILASINCKFRIPLTHPDSIFSATKAKDMGNDRFTMKHVVISQRYRKIAAEGDAVIVTFDYRQNRKAHIPDILRERITALEGW